MSYEGGGSPGPAGPAGPTGATGAISFSGVTGAVLYYDGSAVTGNSSLTYDGSHNLTNQISGNLIDLDGMGGVLTSIGTPNEGRAIQLYANASSISISDQNTGGESSFPASILLTTVNLDVNINGAYGSDGQYLGSNGAGNVIWSTPNTFASAVITTDLEGVLWTADLASGSFYTDYSISGVYLHTDANVQVTTINGTPSVNISSWVITVVPNPTGGVGGSVRIYVALAPTGPYFLSILVISVGTP